MRGTAALLAQPLSDWRVMCNISICARPTVWLPRPCRVWREAGRGLAGCGLWLADSGGWWMELPSCCCCGSFLVGR